MVQLFQHGGFSRFWSNKLSLSFNLHTSAVFTFKETSSDVGSVHKSSHTEVFNVLVLFSPFQRNFALKDLFLNQEGEKYMTKWCSKKFKNCLKSNKANPLAGTRNSIETGESRRAELVSVKLCLSEVCRDCHISERSTHR